MLYYLCIVFRSKHEYVIVIYSAEYFTEFTVTFKIPHGGTPRAMPVVDYS